MRKSAGLTKAEVAVALGVSQARISQIEHGQVDSLDTLRADTEALGAEVSIVVSRDRPQAKNSSVVEVKRATPAQPVSVDRYQSRQGSASSAQSMPRR
ncbi:helix-turn-helix protein [Micromonospora sp. Llam0]|nr:helix-turn-helix protein [Micromonospora sp. Llam0]